MNEILRLYRNFIRGEAPFTLSVCNGGGVNVNTYWYTSLGATVGLSLMTIIPYLSVSSRSSSGGGCSLVRMELALNH